MNKIMFVRVSKNCNSNCYMCGFARTHGSHNLTIEEYKSFLKRINEKEYRLIRFTGGEPLLNVDLAKMIKESNKHNYKTSIITNGLLLKEKYKELIDSGLNQIIISLDGSKEDIHEKTRRVNGIYKKVITSIAEIKEYNTEIIIRVNTIANKDNIDDLLELYELLNNLKVDQWSIIPIKGQKNHWNDGNEEEYIKKYINFVTKINESYTKILGYSRYWAGRNDKEIKDFFYNNKIYKTNQKCNVPYLVSFWKPEENEILPCNCFPHHEIKKICEYTNKEKWLSENSTKVCDGCEPINVYLSEHQAELNDDIFIF